MRAATNLEYSTPAGDAPCPHCGHLLWMSAELLSLIETRLSESLDIASEKITADARLADIGADSRDMVELIMEWEEEFDITITGEDAERIRTVGDAIRYLQQQRRKRKD